MSKRQKAPEPGHDAEIILLCAKYVALWHEQQVIAGADEWAADRGPLHARFEAISAKTSEIARKLYGLRPPSTQGGISAMAEAAITHWPMRADHKLECASISDWMALAVVQGVTGNDRRIYPGETLRYFVNVEASP
jgi:hypothetical protein